MPSTNFVAPATAEDAVRALQAPGAHALAGGTDLVVQMRAGRLRPGGVVDLKRIPALTGVRNEGGVFVIGAATPGVMIGEDKGLAQAWPGVVEAANLIGSTQIQARATLAGNVCNASPAADSVPALIAARAVCVILGPQGRREVPVEAIAVGPGSNSLAAGEIVTEFRLPKRPARAADAYLRLTPRTEMDIAVVGAAVNLTLAADGRIEAAEVALGAVAPTALHVRSAATALIGARLEPQTLDALAAAVRAVCRPIDDKRGTAAYRTHIAGVLVRRAAQTAYERAGAR